MADKVKIAGAIAMIKTSFPNWSPDTVQTAEVWTLLLGDLDNETLQTSVIALITEPGRVFAPSIGEIRGQALKLNALASGLPEPWQAYNEVVNMPAEMKRPVQAPPGYPEYEVVDGVQKYIIYTQFYYWSHPLVGEVAKIMGWPKKFPTDTPTIDRSQFIKAYEAERDRNFSETNRIKLVTDFVDNKRALLTNKEVPQLTSVERTPDNGYYY